MRKASGITPRRSSTFFSSASRSFFIASWAFGLCINLRSRSSSCCRSAEDGMTIYRKQAVKWAVHGLNFLFKVNMPGGMTLNPACPQRILFALLELVVARISYQFLRCLRRCGGKSNRTQSPSNERRLRCGRKFRKFDIKQGPISLLKRTLLSRWRRNCTESPNPPRTHNSPDEEDGYPNGKERHRPCNLVEVQQ
jgi:hypothetical protein